MKTKYIKSFLFQKAQYRLEDKLGNTVILTINYWEGEYEVKTLLFIDDSIDKLNDEATGIAQDLLKRKHKVNFAQCT